MLEKLTQKSFYQVLEEYKKEQEEQHKEYYSLTDVGTTSRNLISNLLYGLYFIFWFYVLVQLLGNLKELPTWVSVLGLVCLFAVPMGSVITLILVYYFNPTAFEASLMSA